MFEIGRIRFRPLRKEDLPTLEKWENSNQVTLYARCNPLVFKSFEDVEEDYEEYLKNEDKYRFMIELCKDEKTIGIATYEDHSNTVRNADIGTYVGNQEYWNKGLGKEITLGLCEMLFFHENFDRISAWSSSINKRAHKVLKALNFKRVGKARKSGYLFGKRIDWYMFDLLREEYLEDRDELLGSILEDKAEYLKNYCMLKVPKKMEKD